MVYSCKESGYATLALFFYISHMEHIALPGELNTKVSLIPGISEVLLMVKAASIRNPWETSLGDLKRHHCLQKLVKLTKNCIHSFMYCEI